LNQSMQSFSEFWAARDTRERMMIAVAAIVAALGLTFTLLIAPALAGREQLGKNMPELRQQVAQMQAMSKEAAEISGKPAPPMAAMSKESIEAALARKGLKTQSVILAGDRIKVQLVAASFADTLGWLDDMQKTTFLSVIDANIVALPQTDKVDATLTLHQQRNE
jgi:general secretion pathway protein M